MTTVDRPPVRHVATAELEQHLDDLRSAPADHGRVALVVRRPGVGEREVLDVGELDLDLGLIGDTWDRRPSSSTVDRSPDPDKQLNVMGIRVAELVADGPERVPLAGDQLFLDLDLSEENLPAGTRLALGTAVIEVTEKPHTGCAKFVSRYGADAMRFVNGRQGRPLRLRGLCARVVVAGRVRPGDTVTKLPATP